MAEIETTWRGSIYDEWSEYTFIDEEQMLDTDYYRFIVVDRRFSRLG